MKVTIYGTGNMGRGIGTRLVSSGQDVQILGSEREKAEELAEELRGKAADGADVDAGSSGDDVEGEVVVLALWYDPAKSLVSEQGDQLAGKVVADISNPVDVETFDGLVTPPDSSAAEEIAKALPEDAKVVKAFNTTFAGTLVDGEVAGQPLDVFIAGDDEDAKGKVSELAESVGLNPIDAGPLKRARELEALGFLHMGIQDGIGARYDTAIKVLSA
jgi:8-hydroxy-5-deazaflavin:NADPH oxidoreductase